MTCEGMCKLISESESRIVQEPSLPRNRSTDSCEFVSFVTLDIDDPTPLSV